MAHSTRLVEDLHGSVSGRGVNNSRLEALGRVRDVDEPSRLSAGAVDGHRDVEGRLHEEPVVAARPCVSFDGCWVGVGDKI